MQISRSAPVPANEINTQSFKFWIASDRLTIPTMLRSRAFAIGDQASGDRELAASNNQSLGFSS